MVGPHWLHMMNWALWKQGRNPLVFTDIAWQGVDVFSRLVGGFTSILDHVRK